MSTENRIKLADAIRDEHPCLKICTRHAEIVYFDGPRCPACNIMREHDFRETGKYEPIDIC